jgi:hypothetical protein
MIFFDSGAMEMRKNELQTTLKPGIGDNSLLGDNAE